MSENKNFFRASAEDFKKIPGSPVAYWLKGQDLFLRTKVGDLYISGGRNKTHGNELYLRNWWEPSFKSTRWMVYANGGEFRKYFGNEIDVVDWSDEARSSYESHGGLVNKKFWGHQGICWSLITSASTSFRIKSAYAQYSSGSPTLFDEHLDFSFETLAYLNSPIVRYFLKALNPTINTTFNDVATLPYAPTRQTDINDRVYTLVSLSRKDWDAYERSRNFTVNPLVAERGVSGQSVVGSEQNGGLITDHCPLSTLYSRLREKWAKDCEEMRRLETENNRIFIEAYGLQDELTPEVPWHEITLTCNPWYRYGVKVDSGQCAVGSAASDHCILPTDNLLEERLKGDTVKELISYAVGCMMGRYSLEKPGLILADQGAQISDQWIVVSGQLVLRGKVAECVRKELQRIDCLAEGDGSCGRSVSTGETAPDGGTVCIVGSASSGGGFNSVECRRGAGAEYDAGLHELSDNGTRVVLRDGNTIVDLCSAEVLDAIASGSGAELVRRGWKDAERIDWKTIHSSLTTSHFSPDEDGIIPILDNDWFADDIVTQFEKFLVAAFGAAQLGANRAFIEQALGKDLRSYFVKDFYADHLQRYQKRPIYWLFSSPKGTFNALVYLHRYQPNTAGQVLGYLRSFITKLQAKIEAADKTAADPSASQSFRTRAIKERTKLARQLKELEDYERDVLHPLSLQHVALDLDDGVKVNYLKLGAALKKIPGLEAKE